MSPEGRQPIPRAKGVTATERYLNRLCNKSFLSLWSYASVYRNEHWGNPGSKEGKELCDALVVFDNDIIIFSDKDCKFGDSGDLLVDWARWYRKAIKKSADQIFGAERCLKARLHGLFLDSACTIPFPIDLPYPSNARFHRIVVAHDGSRACKQQLGGSGSLMIRSDISEDDHLANPFSVGRVDSRGYVHVFDDTTLDIVLQTLDTITDFIAYLRKKEAFLSTRVVSAAGEEELLALYLEKLNRNGEHDFVVPAGYDALTFTEGLWESFVNNPQRKSQIEADRVSYMWDRLIETFAHHLLNGTQYFGTGGISEQEIILRFMAREPRTRRRMLSNELKEKLLSTPSGQRGARGLLATKAGEPYYVFLLYPRDLDVDEKDYREARRELLLAYCAVVRLRNPTALDIIGIATEPGDGSIRTEDAIYFDGRHWTRAEADHARQLQDELGILKDVKYHAGTEHEYPMGDKLIARTEYSRNSSCICGSGKRFKRCCGRPK